MRMSTVAPYVERFRAPPYELLIETFASWTLVALVTVIAGEVGGPPMIFSDVMDTACVAESVREAPPVALLSVMVEVPLKDAKLIVDPVYIIRS